MAAPRLMTTTERIAMPDLIYVAVTIGFFLLALAYVRGCDKL